MRELTIAVIVKEPKAQKTNDRTRKKKNIINCHFMALFFRLKKNILSIWTLD